MNSQKGINRRQFLKGASIGMLGLITVCGGGGLLANLPPAVDFPEAAASNGSRRILVTYATKAGSTGEVAAAIAEVLKSNGLNVELLLMKHVSDLSLYQGAIIGGCIRMGKWLPEVNDFIKQHQQALNKMPVSYFLTCATLREDTEANRNKVAAVMDDAKALVNPYQIGLFAGKMDSSKLSFLDRSIANMVGSVEGDFRDWNLIKAWAAEALPRL
ncbi:MAG: flavodoxin domain-containing protein [Anaerolineae bacterium]|nr:flavodoxin domain-containing protein [Anaerolineae bacterium]